MLGSLCHDTVSGCEESDGGCDDEAASALCDAVAAANDTDANSMEARRRKKKMKVHGEKLDSSREHQAVTGS